ncbi:MAG: hypothetical protein AAF901_13335 [Bacteroidota bacterium]
MKYQIFNVMNIKTILKISMLTAIMIVLASCEPEEVVTEIVVSQGDVPVEESPFKTSGFIASSILSTPNSFSYFTQYFEEMPSGNIDLTTEAASSFSGYFPQTIYKNFGFGASLDNDNLELARYAVDNNTNRVVRAGAIPLSASLSQVLILNDNLGAYTIFDTPSVFLFNPTTMQFIEEIPMPQAVQVEVFPNQSNSYFHIIYREQDNRLFLPLTTNSNATPPFYDALDIYVEVINLNTRTWEKTAVFPGATYPLTRGMENPIVDENGNIYLLTQGSYSLDGQLGPTANPGSRPQFIRIPSGSTDFDPDYAFNPVNFIGFQNLVAQLCTGSIYDQNGIAYAAMTAQPDNPRVLELLALLGAGTITDAEFNELANLITNSPNMKWTRIDLNAQTAEVISDIPFTAAFVYPFSYKYDDKLYFQVFNPDAGNNGYYEYDPATGAARSAYTVAAGGVATQFVKLQE